MVSAIERSSSDNDEDIDVLVKVSHQLAKVLDCGLSENQVSTMLMLLKVGEHPEALAVLLNKHRQAHSRSTGYLSWE